MSDFAYGYLEKGYQDREVKYVAPKHIHLLEHESKREEVSSTVSQKAKEVCLSDTLNENLKYQVEEITESEQVENLMEGATNLLNMVIEKSKRGEPVQTLLFMDKSARNGAYVFRCLWEELEERSEIPVNVTKPEIRFVNVGIGDDEKHNQEPPRYLFKEKYREQDYIGKNVLVVDEIVASGGSIRRAMKSLEDIFGVSSSGIANFKYCPQWYGEKDSGILGVTDMESDYRYRALREKFNRMSLETTEMLSSLAKRLGKDDFSDTVNKARYLRDKQITSIKIHELLTVKWKREISTKEVEDLCLFADRTGVKTGEGEYVWQYIDSAGGFVSRKIEDDELNKNGRYYRKVLKTIVSIFMLERDLDMEDKSTQNS